MTISSPLVQKVLCQKLDPNWRESYRQVAAVLSQTVRASSAVECMNSVLRMHQSRHRTLTQGMLDLKRLYWNCRVFRGGKRKGRCPYEHLGLKLPSYDFWSSAPSGDEPQPLPRRRPRPKRKPWPSRLDVRSVKLELAIWDDAGLLYNHTHEVHPLKHQEGAGRILPSVNLKTAPFAPFWDNAPFRCPPPGLGAIWVQR